MTISTVYIATFRGDLRLTRICVASVRYWYPDIPVILIRDWSQGVFSTTEIQNAFNVGVFEGDQRDYGWGFSKLEPLFLPRRERFLILDSDTVLTGPVLDVLNSSTADFIVDDETQSPAEVKRLYFNIDALRQIDTSFEPCGKNFNSGQWVGTSGILSREHFESVVKWGNPPRLRYPEVFMPGDQGILNYVLEALANKGELDIDRIDLMWWAPRDLEHLSLASMVQDSPYRQVIHWAGSKHHRLGKMPRADILKFFENYYYSRVPLSRWQKALRDLEPTVSHHRSRCVGKLRQLLDRSPVKERQ